MKPAPFLLHRPATVEDAVRLLASVADEGGLVLAGGQSLVPMMALRVVYPPALIDINAIAGLNRVLADGAHLSIGATVRHAYFHRPPPNTNRLGELLAFVSRHIAHYPIRMRGTFCGQPRPRRSGVRMVSRCCHPRRRGRPDRGRSASPNFAGHGILAGRHGHCARAK